MYSLPPFQYSLPFEGTELIGNVKNCSIASVSVEIISPFSGITKSQGCALLSLMSPLSRGLDAENKLTSTGIWRIERSLISANQIALDLTERKVEILKNYELYCREILQAENELLQCSQFYAMEIPRLRKLLKQDLKNKSVEHEYVSLRRQKKADVLELQKNIEEIWTYKVFGNPRLKGSLIPEARKFLGTEFPLYNRY